MSTLLLSGWAQPVDALAHLVDDAVLFDYSDHASPEAAIEAMRDLKAEKVIGWSLGGQLAMRAIAAGALKPQHLTLIAAPLQFVSTPELKGMDATTYQLFRESYAKEPARTKERFHALVAKGDVKFRAVMDLLGHHPQVEDTRRFLPWLDALAAHRFDRAQLASFPRTLIIHGMNDHIVPLAQSEALVQLLPDAKLQAWEGVGHAPHLHDADRLREALR